MFSNIRTEGTGNNHLFVPRLRLFGYQDDLVEILESNDRQLQQYVSDERTFLPGLNFEGSPLLGSGKTFL